MTKLSVNVNKLATLRNARGKNSPDLVEFGRHILEWGAHGLTVHPRPDGRHIRYNDVTALAAVVREFNQDPKNQVEFNIEGYPSQEFLDLVAAVQPDQATLVPDSPEAITSNAGWRVEHQQRLLQSVIAEIHRKDVRVSVFIEPATMTEKDFVALKTIATDRIELYTEAFAETFESPGNSPVLQQYASTARRCREMGIEVNAGHDLNQRNLGTLIKAVPEIAEVSIGHALVCEALYQGFETTVQNYLRILGWRP